MAPATMMPVPASAAHAWSYVSGSAKMQRNP